MLTYFLAEDLDEEVGAGVGDLWVVAEVWGCGDEDTGFDDSGDAIEVADGDLEGGEGVEGALVGALLGGGFIDLSGDDSCGDHGAVVEGYLS